MKTSLALWVCAFVVCLGPSASQAQSRASVRVKPGIEVLKESGYACLQGKRVGLITNPSGIDSRLNSTIDLLHQAPGVKLAALFGPEHGVRGDALAGAAVQNATDPLTGVPVFSLYGATRKPTPAMLEGLDVLVYDIQDVGCRSYTYISTLGLAMEAAAAAGLEFVVLDRPNPLGGLRVEGPLPAPDKLSFVCAYPIPYVYGLTCGELARWLNLHWLPREGGPTCALKVVAMEGWQRDMAYEDTGLPWVPASPHIPEARSALFYPLSGIVGELGQVSIGVGYTLPFQLFGREDISGTDLAAALNALQLPGLHFRPLSYKPFYGFGAGKTLQGVQVHILDPVRAPLTQVNFYVLQELHRLYPALDFFKNCTAAKRSMLEKVCGGAYVTEVFGKDYEYASIREWWERDAEAFKTASRECWLYPRLYPGSRAQAE